MLLLTVKSFVVPHLKRAERHSNIITQHVKTEEDVPYKRGVGWSEQSGNQTGRM